MLASGAALLLGRLLQPPIPPDTFLSASAAVLLSAWYGGLGPGLLATFLGAAAHLVLAHPLTAATGPAFLRCSLFVVGGALMSWLTATVVAGQRRVAKTMRLTRDELDRCVKERTAELAQANRVLQEEVARRQRLEGALRESEERFRATFEQAAVGLAHVGLDGRWLLLNQKLCDIVGYPREELLAMTFQDITHPDDLEADLALMRRMLANEIQAYAMEKRYFRKDGSVVWVNLSASFVRDASGQAKYGVAVVEDITARKETEEELAKLNARTRDMLESLSDGFFALDHEARFTYVNPRAARMLLRDRQELIGKRIWDIFPTAVGAAFHRQYEEARSKGAQVVAEAYAGPQNRWFRAHGYPSRDGLSVLFEDVTERHQNELVTLSDVLRVLNAHLTVSEAFPEVAAALQVLTGCDRSSLSVTDEQGEWVTVVALDQPREYLTRGVRLRASDISSTSDLRVGRPHVVDDLATELDFPLSRFLYEAGYRSRLSVPLQGRQRVMGALNLSWCHTSGFNTVRLSLVRQVADALALAMEKGRLFEEVRAGRERLQALSERLLQAQEDERRQVAGELHEEIGQALTALKLMLDGLDGQAPAAVSKHLAEAQRTVDGLLSRVRRMALDLRPAMLDDLGLVPALLSMFQRCSTQMGIETHFEHSGLEERLTPQVETAAYRIIQEALTNVGRHAGVKQVSVRVRVDHRIMRLQISDEGRGFEPESVYAAAAGSGLSSMGERARLLGGQLSVNASPGKGTRVSAEIPLHGRMGEQP